ncbi:MAG: pre-peptidase C-terminal domain-containing protein [Chloroflexi bacterium]|nr:pre-peptidase C-terminal domain-containing protein [Chloroflexota bacterium]
MRQQSLKLLSLLFVLFALLAATTSPVAQADVEEAKSPPPTSDEVATLTLDPALLVGLENRAPLAPMAPLGVNTLDETEPNGTPATANTIAGDAAVVEGNIFPNADVDYYAFTAQAGDKLYAAVMDSFGTSGSNDSQLRLFNTDGTTLIEFDEGDGSFGILSSSLAGATLPAAGTYYMEVRHVLATRQLRPYYLYFRLQRGAPTPETESNNTPGTANPLPPNGWVSGTANPAADNDIYAFSANAGDTIFLSLDLDLERDNVQWNGRLGFGLFGDANDQFLVANDASVGSVANPLSEAFFITVKDAGTYYVSVDHSSAGSGDPTFTYQLSVTIFPAVDEGVNCTTYTSTDVPQVIPTDPGMVSSTLTVPGNPRIADIDVFITLDHTFMADLDFHLRSPAGNDNGLFTDIGSTIAGGQTQMELILDDEAAIPSSFTVVRPFIIKPELAYRLAWFDGIDAGGTWTLDIRDDATGDGGNLTAWGIRICEPEPLLACPMGTSATTIYSSDFESDDGGFTHSGVQDEWEWGLPTFAPIVSCNSGTGCWKTDLDDIYNVNSNQNLLSPAIDLTTAGLVGPVYFTWAQKYQIENATFDHAWVDVQQAGGASPTRLWEWLDATMTNVVGNPTVTISESAGWGVHTRDISSYLGQNIEVLFHLDSDTTTQLGGLAIDDVAVTACLTIPDTDGDGVNDLLECPAPGDYTNPPSCANADGAGAVDMLDPLTICGLGTVPTGQDWAFATTHPITLSVQTQGTLECVQISETAGVHPQGTTNGAAVENNWWYTIHSYDMARTQGAPNGSFSTTLTMPTSFTTGAQSKLCRHTAGPGAGWDCAGSASGANAVQRSGITAFSEWSAGEAVGPTAVTLQNTTTAAPQPWLVI